MALDVAVVMDPIEKIKIGKDTSFAMMLEAQRRGHRLHYVLPGGLSMEGSRSMARLAPVTVRDDPADWYRLGEPERQPLADFDVVLMRTDPPVDAAYLHDSHILSVARDEGVLVRLPRLVARRGEVRHAGRLHVVHGLGDDAVLEHRRGEVADVVHDHLGPLIAQGEDVVRKTRLAAEACGEREARPRGHVVDDLQHRPALIRFRVLPAR